jgi:hypothetical protein
VSNAILYLIVDLLTCVYRSVRMISIQPFGLSVKSQEIVPTGRLCEGGGFQTPINAKKA